MDDERNEMAWPREHDDESLPNKDDLPSTREAERIVKAALQDRQPHVTPFSEKQIEAEAVEEQVEQIKRRELQREADPIFVLMVVGAISVGLTPVEALVRYTILWTLLAAAGLVAYTLGSAQHIKPPTLDDLLAGIIFGAGMGISFLILLGSPLATISERMFDVRGVSAQVMNTWVFMAVVFVQSTADTLFFRGAMQQFRSMLITAGLATIWSVVLFFPHMELRNALGVATMLAILFAFLNFFYGYVRFRNGLAASWICQIIGGGLLWFAPRLLF